MRAGDEVRIYTKRGYFFSGKITSVSDKFVEFIDEKTKRKIILSTDALERVDVVGDAYG